MINKALLYGVIGFIAGGLLVSSAFALADKKDTVVPNSAVNKTLEHNAMSADKLKTLQGDAFDKEFMAEMIRHHQSALDMAQLTASNAKHDEIKQLGKDIMAAQSKEIDLMQTWQTDWGYKSTPQSHDMRMMH